MLQTTREPIPTFVVTSAITVVLVGELVVHLVSELTSISSGGHPALTIRPDRGTIRGNQKKPTRTAVAGMTTKFTTLSDLFPKEQLAALNHVRAALLQEPTLLDNKSRPEAAVVVPKQLNTEDSSNGNS